MTPTTHLREIFSNIEEKAAIKTINKDIIQLLESILEGNHHIPLTIQKHPLGFFAYRWPIENGVELRVHIWDKNFTWSQKPEWQIHDHNFGFTSIVLTGKIQNKTYALSKNSPCNKSWGVYEVKYNNQNSELKITDKSISIQIESSELITSSKYYQIQPFVLHRSKMRSAYAITVLATRKKSTKPHPIVIGDALANSLSFSRSDFTPEEVVTITENAIKKLKQKA